MSSLASQLKSISDKSASIALNRQQRSKIHSRSLIFDPKVAASQDYDEIYDVAIDALDELCELDSRFNKFKNSLFANDSINFDRNVQSEDVVTQLDQNINAFFTLLGPYYNFTAALRASEWLVRRFQANMHNLEYMILTALPYYMQPVFVKILNVIPKQNIPQIFEWLVTAKDQLRSPTLQVCFRAFFNDNHLFTFYSSFLDEQIKRNTTYKEQLVFYLSITIQLLPASNKNTLNETLIPVVLRSSDLMLTSKNSSLRLGAYSVLAVLSAVAPLSIELLNTLTFAVLANDIALEAQFAKQTVFLLIQLWTSTTELTTSEALSKTPSLPINIIEHIDISQAKKDKFLAIYFSSIFPSETSLQLLNMIELKGNKRMFKFVVHSVLSSLKPQHLNGGVTSNNNSTNYKDTILDIVRKLIKLDQATFNEMLKSLGLTVSELELTLEGSLLATHSGDEKLDELGDNVDGDDDTEYTKFVDEKQDDKEDGDENTKFDISKLGASAPTYLDSKYNPEFYQLSFAFTRFCSKVDIKSQRAAILHFTHKVFQNPALSITFLLRVGLSLDVPLLVRLNSIKAIQRMINNTADGKTDFYLILPLLLIAFNDPSSHIRAAFAQLVQLVSEITKAIHENKKKQKTLLFFESEVYANSGEKKMISPQDAIKLFAFIGSLDGMRLEEGKIATLLKSIFNGKFDKKTLGSLYQTFILNQWAQPSLPIVIKQRVWSIASQLNEMGVNGVRTYFWDTDIKPYLAKREEWLVQAKEAKLADDYNIVEKSLVQLVGGDHLSAEDSNSVSHWLCQALDSNTSLQLVANERITSIFPKLTSVESKVIILSKLVDLLVSDDYVEFDPMITLQSLPLDSAVFLQILENVKIGDQMPEQGVVKRRRRSSNSTKQAMAKSDMTYLASQHLRKLSVILEVLEVNLRKATIANPKLLKVLFKILSDLDYLGNDGNLPILYAQEVLASCLLLSISELKNSNHKHQLDSNSVRADLIVNSLRNSSSPQVQNRLLLVISELATLAPEIILHSVMPIFTFMGAHTIRQDDEFSNDALQKTVARVIPALASTNSGSFTTEIEFLLASFTAAFKHIPSHRRVRLFVALTKTLKPSNSMHILIYLLGEQYYQAKMQKNALEMRDIETFVTAYLKAFAVETQLNGLDQFSNLLNELPRHQLEENSKTYDQLRSRPIFGLAVVNSTTEELLKKRLALLEYLNSVLELDSANFDVTSLKSRIDIALKESSENDTLVLPQIRHMTSFALSELDIYTNTEPHPEISAELFVMLTSLVDLLPVVKFVESITEFLDVDKLGDNTAIKVGRNYAVLAARKFENEISLTLESVVENFSDLDKLFIVLLKGIERNVDLELQQAYLNLFAVITLKLGVDAGLTAKFSSVLIKSLGVITTSSGLLSSESEIVIASISAIVSIVNVLGIKTLGLFPKIIPPTLKIWEQTTTTTTATTTRSISATKIGRDEQNESSKLVQESVLLLLSCYIKKMPSFMVTTLDSVILTILNSDLTESQIKSSIMNLIIDRVNIGQVFKSLCSVWTQRQFYQSKNPASLGLYLNSMESTINKLEKREAISEATVFMKWLIQAFEFRDYSEKLEHPFDINTIHRMESSFHSCAIAYVMKLNDKSFRPLFANLVRWAIDGENSIHDVAKTSRLLSFYRFFNKLQELLKSIVTSYYSYLVDATSECLKSFASEEDKGNKDATTLRRIVLISLSLSFTFDQDEYWSQQGRFDSICQPLLDQLSNIEESIGKFLVKTITNFVSDISSKEHSEVVLKGLVKFISYDTENLSNTKIWTIRTLKSIFQKMGEQWLSYLPILVPHIAELLEDDDEAVEIEVREGLVRVIEKVLGEPLDRYLS